MFQQIKSIIQNHLEKNKIIYYSIVCTYLLSGFGISFLNAESLVAISFFIFVVLIVVNSNVVLEGFEQHRKLIKRRFSGWMFPMMKMEMFSKTVRFRRKESYLRLLREEVRAEIQKLRIKLL